MAKKLKGGDSKNAFSKLMARPLAARTEKNRDLVLLSAFVGEMPGVPFSCAAAVKGVFVGSCN